MSQTSTGRLHTQSFDSSQCYLSHMSAAISYRAFCHTESAQLRLGVVSFADSVRLTVTDFLMQTRHQCNHNVLAVTLERL